jgi:hypothetical protein
MIPFAELSMASSPLTDWLHSLDSYTNAEFGRSLTHAGTREECVACGAAVPSAGADGLCAKCVEKRRPDHTEIVLFRALRRPTPKV